MTNGRKRSRNAALGKVVLGLYLILIGGLILAANMGYDVRHGVWNYWPFLLLAAGGAKVLFGDRESISEGVWLLLAGLYCWVSVWNLWGLSWGTAWPIFVVAGGLSMLLEPWLKRHGFEEQCIPGVGSSRSTTIETPKGDGHVG